MFYFLTVYSQPNSFNRKSTLENIKNTIAIKLTGGIGFYGYVHNPGPGWTGLRDDTPEGLIAYNLGAEISKKGQTKLLGNYNTNMSLNINFSSYPGMQRYYVDGLTERYQTMYLTKNYLTVGLISEIQRNKESLLITINPGVNITTGKIEDVGKESFSCVAIQTGEYFQHNFKTTRKGLESLSMRIGFEQFFSSQGGYIGQFAVKIII